MGISALFNNAAFKRKFGIAAAGIALAANIGTILVGTGVFKNDTDLFHKLERLDNDVVQNFGREDRVPVSLQERASKFPWSVEIAGYGFHGSGTVIDGKGRIPEGTVLVATAAHCLGDDTKPIEIFCITKQSDGLHLTSLNAVHKWKHPDYKGTGQNDIALLLLRVPDGAEIMSAPVTEYPDKGEISKMGYSFDMGGMSAHFNCSVEGEPDYGQGILYTDCDVASGMSGGTILDKEGRMFAVTARASNEGTGNIETLLSNSIYFDDNKFGEWVSEYVTKQEIFMSSLSTPKKPPKTTI